MRKNFGNENVVNVYYNLMQEDASIRGFKEWLELKLSAFPKGEWGEKTMLLELLDELKNHDCS